MKIRTLPRMSVSNMFVAGVAILALSACSSSGSTVSSSAPASTDAAATTTGSSDTTPGSSTGEATTTTAAAPVTLQIFSGPGIKFDAANYSATAGVLHVIYENRDSQRHTLAFVNADGKSVAKDLEVVKSGSKDEADITFVAGTYKVICTVPGHQAMKGTLTVK